MKKKIAKQSYFIKRMRDSGYHIRKIFDGYSKSDFRDWTILINAGESSVYCTCCVNHGEDNTIEITRPYFFMISDGGQFIPSTLKLYTDSIEVVISRLIHLGIRPTYNTSSEAPTEKTN